MVRLTTAHYYTPAGRSIQKPYKRDDFNDDYSRDIIDRFNSGELMSADSIHFADSLKVNTLRLKRPVYGGGGIMPDRFVPLDTAFYSPGTATWWPAAYSTATRSRISTPIAANSRSNIPRWSAFIERFEVTDDMMADLTALGTEQKIEADEEGIATSGPYMREIVKALIARDLFDQSAYYRVSNRLDPVYVEALRIITDPEAYSAILPD